MGRQHDGADEGGGGNYPQRVEEDRLQMVRRREGVIKQFNRLLINLILLCTFNFIDIALNRHLGGEEASFSPQLCF
jgi:hypothetical protein